MRKSIFTLALLLTGMLAFGQHTQVKLKYSFSELEPYIDSVTMRVHYSNHHAAYTRNLNAALQPYSDLKSMPLLMLLKNINSLPAEIQATVRNSGGGVFNHNLYFSELTNPKNSIIPKEFSDILVEQYGSVDSFKKAVETAAKSRFGSGWAWVLVKADGKLSIISTANQDAPFMDVAFSEGVPIMNVDVWEHAYYLKYQDKRAEYLKNIWNVIDWNFVYDGYKKATGRQ